MRMRKLIALSLGLLLVSGSAFAAKEPTFSSWTNLSERAQADVGGAAPVRILKWVRFADQGLNKPSVASGDVLAYDLNSADGVSVTYHSISGDNSVAGIAVTTISSLDTGTGGANAFQDSGKKNWGWVITHGPAFANANAGGTNGAANGAAVIASVDAGKISGFPLGTGENTGSLATALQLANGALGFFLQSADTSSTSYLVFVQNNL